MSRPKVVVYSWLVRSGEIEREILSKINADVVVIPPDQPEVFFQEIKDADGLLISNTEIHPEHVKDMKNCKIIARQGVGFNNIDLVSTKEKGIIVTNVPDYCMDEVSDFTIALMLCALRHIPTYDKHIREGIWFRGSIMSEAGFPPMRRLNRLTLGLVGFGRIGREVARKAKVFGFNLLTSDPYVTTEMAEEEGVELVDFDYLIQEADVVSIHSPLTPETRHLFNLDVFKKMKSTAVLVNTSRGPLVKEDDIIVALKERMIQIAALDVTEIEPLPIDSELKTLENVILTPHVAYFTAESYEELRRRAAEEVVRVLTGEDPHSRVNL